MSIKVRIVGNLVYALQRIGYELVFRRAYGWEVPTDKRVFLEGDVRLEIHSVKPLKNKVYHSFLTLVVHIVFPLSDRSLLVQYHVHVQNLLWRSIFTWR